MDPDRPERWSWLDIPAWFVGLWPALKDHLHRWLHDSLPDCPYCAEWRDEADRQANEALRLHTLLARQYQEREVTPGTVTPEDLAVAYDLKAVPNLEQVIAKMAGPPKPAEPELPREPRDLIDPDELDAFAFDLAAGVALGKGGIPLTQEGTQLMGAASTLTHAADRIRSLTPDTAEIPSESDRLTYAQVVAMQREKPPPVIPEAMSDAAKTLACPPLKKGEWGRVKLPVAPLVLTKGETRLGCTVREATAGAREAEA